MLRSPFRVRAPGWVLTSREVQVPRSGPTVEGMPLHRWDGPAPDTRRDAGHGDGDRHRIAVNPFYGEANPVAGMTEAPPRHRLPDAPLAPSTAYQLVHDELMLDGNSRL